jgi:hypothetical protein
MQGRISGLERHLMRSADRKHTIDPVLPGGASAIRALCAILAAGLPLALVPIALAGTPSTAPTTKPTAVAMEAQPMWVNHIEPILNHNCFKCHGSLKQKGGLDLRQPQAILEGGTDGSVVIPGRPLDSPLYQRLQPGNDQHMPPGDSHQLSVEEISYVQNWIATLPTPNHPPITGAGRSSFDQTAPSLIEQAAQVKWEPPAGMAASDAIDYLIQNHWQAQHVSGNGICDDRTFVRRVYLDLAGRIPTRAEADSFAGSTDSQKRAALVDQLLAGPEYPRHIAEVLDVVLMGRKSGKGKLARASSGWPDYLQTSIAKNRPWNKMVAELISGRPESPEQKGAAWFLYDRRNNYQQMAEAAAPLAFGVSIGCAQCHNDPLAHEIKQANYWGLVAGFNRSTNVDTSDGPALAESAVGGFVNFTNLKKESQPAILALLNNQTIPEQRPADGVDLKDSNDNYLIPPSANKNHVEHAAVPKFSRRGAVADAVTHNNPLLARAFVNRIWAMMLGRGIVSPVDQMDSRHPPSHPELLSWLAADFERSGYDIKHLIRTIALSHTYQLDSHWNQAAAPAPELFARGLEKPLSAEVLGRSLLIATGHDPSSSLAAPDAEPLRNALVAAFPGLFDVEYNATLQQAIFLTNNPLLDGLLKPQNEDLTARVLTLPTSEAKVDALFAEVLGRAPDADERAAAIAYLDARKDRPEAGVKQLSWALLTGTEFLMNH